MKALIQHLLANNINEIMAKSLLDCHVKGVHSIMLLESPGKTIRLYIATEEHELWRNTILNALLGYSSVGYHAHHCALTLHCIYGDILNSIITEKGVDKETPLTLNRWNYKSPVTNAKGYFELPADMPCDHFKVSNQQWINEKGYLYLKASDIHTVYVRKKEKAAWLVYEGREDPLYKPYCWSNSDLSAPISKKLYRKPSIPEVMKLLRSVSLI